MEIGYYPGCSLESTAKEFDLSIRAVFQQIGVSLKEIPDWNCCGASPAHSLNEELAKALPYRNLAMAEAAGLDRVISPCPACFSHLRHVHEEIKREPRLFERLRELTGKEYQRGVQSKHLLDFMKEDIGFDQLKHSLKVPLPGLKVVGYYGCLTRLPGVELDDAENPVLMDEIIELIGGEALNWSHKTECCGASLSVTRTEIALRLVRAILEAAQDRGAECIAVVCPLCQSNLDTRQKDVNKVYETNFHIPVLYLSQLIGLAQGLDYHSLGLDRLIVSPKPLLLERGMMRK